MHYNLKLVFYEDCLNGCDMNFTFNFVIMKGLRIDNETVIGGKKRIGFKDDVEEIVFYTCPTCSIGTSKPKMIRNQREMD